MISDIPKLVGPDLVFHTTSDHVVLRQLYGDIEHASSNAGVKDAPSPPKPSPGPDDVTSLKTLADFNDKDHVDFQPSIFCSWDHEWKKLSKPTNFSQSFLFNYAAWARTIVRHDTDVVFLSHIIIYFCTSVPSAIYLFYDFHYLHAVAHLAMTVWYSGAFTLMMHNHIHNNGILKKQYAAFDWVFPYFLEPLMGHTWDSYYYHHIKAHHVEGNGPDDLSSTIRYQRDSFLDFLRYETRFLLLCWFDLPRYFVSKRKYNLAFRVTCTELGSYFCLFCVSRWNFRPALFTLLLPFTVMRLGMMIGNWGQHAIIDEVDPNSDFRSSITLIDVPSNRFCFNDGYHTSHHLNPLRHWRDHPHAFLSIKDRYASEGALVFQGLDYLELTFRLLTKNYLHLAGQMVPIGEAQIAMTLQEKADMLRRKTRKFEESEIEQFWGKKSKLGRSK